MTSNHFNKGVSSNEIQNVWTPQIDEWDCWVAAFSAALKFWNLPSNHKYILGFLLDTNLKISEVYGGYFTYLAIIAYKMGLCTYLKCPLEKNLHELSYLLDETAQKETYIKVSQLDKETLSQIAVEARKEMYPRGYLYDSLAIISDTKLANNCLLYLGHNKPSFQNIKNYIRRGLPVVVYVRSDEYYHLPGDDSGHLVTFIPVTDSSNGYLILDSYRDRGFQSDKNWETALSISEKFNWDNWSDWMLAIAPK